MPSFLFSYNDSSKLLRSSLVIHKTRRPHPTNLVHSSTSSLRCCYILRRHRNKTKDEKKRAGATNPKKACAIPQCKEIVYRLSTTRLIYTMRFQEPSMAPGRLGRDAVLPGDFQQEEQSKEQNKREAGAEALPPCETRAGLEYGSPLL